MTTPETTPETTRFSEALQDPNLAYVTQGHPVWPDCYHVYFRDPTSPTGVRLHMSASKTPENTQVLRESRRSSRLGGQAGTPPER